MNTNRLDNLNPNSKYYIANSLCLLFGVKYTYDFTTIISIKRINSIPSEAIINLVDVCVNDSMLDTLDENSESWTSRFDVLNGILELVTGLKLIEVNGGYRLYGNELTEKIANQVIKLPVYNFTNMAQWIHETITVEHKPDI